MMLEPLIKATLGITVIMIAWLAVQFVFARRMGTPAGEDVMAGRSGCHGCTCQTPCEKRQSENRP